MVLIMQEIMLHFFVTKAQFFALSFRNQTVNLLKRAPAFRCSLVVPEVTPVVPTVTCLSKLPVTSGHIHTPPSGQNTTTTKPSQAWTFPF